ncbi:SDR family oxidoreductase [Leisingera sp. ANG-Vp]|uniref:SDR family oxidoreductase n=1 Tax=Leisingera sp. ANG-Vp TaxID=1577896 RepID=UPI00057E8B27|nr:SDR family oxidoreductase [Leisingera sp. ANG-Vp]KIC17291.1 short-chain dehydrogenase [Leisingera sp. ANG-Vp]
MPQTILITGASSGIGKATARLFADGGWNVVATMRNPEDAEDLAERANVLVAALDVTKPGTIAKAVDLALSTYGRIDVLLNNAGYGAYGPLEAFPMERIERQFATNVIGLLAVTKAVLPHMRAQKSGTIVNISSIGGQMTFPLGTLYHGTKFAVEGLSEALHYELEAVGVKVKIVEPGMINTDFGGRSFDFAVDESMPEYMPVVAGMQAAMGTFGAQASEPELVAEVIRTAVTDGTSQLRYRAGADAEALLSARKTQDDETFIGGIKAGMGL